MVPRRIDGELQLPVIRRRRVARAKGVTELNVCIGVAEVMGGKGYTRILVSDDVDVVLIGVVALETLGFDVDPVVGKLKEAKTYLLQVEDAYGEEG